MTPIERKARAKTTAQGWIAAAVLNIERAKLQLSGAREALYGVGDVGSVQIEEIQAQLKRILGELREVK